MFEQNKIREGNLLELKQGMKARESIKIMDVPVDEKLSALIGFARKARNTVAGFEAVRRAAQKGKLALVLVDRDISGNTLKKLAGVTMEGHIPLFRLVSPRTWNELWGIKNQKVLGITRGNFGRTIIQKIKSGV